MFVAQIEFIFSGMLFLSSQVWTTLSLSGDIYDSITSVSVLCSYFACPFIMLFVFKRNLGELNYEKKFGSLTKETRTGSRLYLAYPFLAWLRRVLFVFILFSDQPTIQIFFYRLFMLLFFVYLGYVQPYIFTSRQTIEVIHELFLLCHGIIMPIYTDFVLDAQTQFIVGYVSIGLFGSQLFLCFIIIVKDSLHILKLHMRKWYNKHCKLRQL